MTETKHQHSVAGLTSHLQALSSRVEVRLTGNADMDAIAGIASLLDTVHETAVETRARSSSMYAAYTS